MRHHPDKRKARGEKVDQDNDYFVCISKAYDILGVPSKRRSYDSVDPEVDDGVPTANEYTKKNFYQVLIFLFKSVTLLFCNVILLFGHKFMNIFLLTAILT